MEKELEAAKRGVQQGAVPQVIVYTSSDCRWCPRAKEYLTLRGVPYTEKNVELDEAAAIEAFNFAGRRQTPVIAFGSRAVVGFLRGEIDALLGLDALGSSGEGEAVSS